MTVSKENIADNFSRSSSSYSEHAFVQKRAAETLFEMLDKIPSAPKKIIEIGCGTGFLTKKLFAKFPDAEFTICDLSEKMIERCKSENADFHGSVEYKVCDVLEILSTQETYDLAISALAFQWLEESFPSVITKIHERLVPGGVLAFSTLTSNTFGKLKEAFKAADTVYPGPELYEASEIKSICSIFKKTHFYQETEIADFATPVNFLRHIKKTGAGNASGKPVPPSVLRKAIEYLANENGGSVREKYELLFAYLEKA